MDRSEFFLWWQHAATAFPAMHKLFERGSDEAKRRSQMWIEALAKVSSTNATDAIDAMVRGDCETPKYDWAELPKYVIRFCEERANAELGQRTEAYYDGPTVRCLYCGDSRSGFTTIWNPLFIEECEQELLVCQSSADVQDVYRLWHRKTDRRLKYKTMAVVCSCDSPAAVAKRAAGSGTVFNAQRMTPALTVAKLQEFLRDESRYEMKFD